MPGHRVLVVDDNQGFRDQVVSALTESGVETFGAPRGSEALRLTASLFPDLLIIDLVRPASEGRWLIERLLRRSDETPLGPPPQVVLGLVPIGGDYSDLTDGVDLQVKPMFASQVVSLAQRLLVQLPSGSPSQPPRSAHPAAITLPPLGIAPTAPQPLGIAPTAPQPRPPLSSAVTQPRPARPSPSSGQAAGLQGPKSRGEDVQIAVEHVSPPPRYRSHDSFEDESSDFDPGQTLLAPVNMQELARSMTRSADDMMAITVSGRAAEAPDATLLGQSSEEIEIIESDSGDAETADTHPRFDVDLRLNPLGAQGQHGAPSSRAMPPPPSQVSDPSGRLTPSASSGGVPESGPSTSIADLSAGLRFDPSEPPATLSGDLEGIALVDIAALLARQGQTGVVRVSVKGRPQQFEWVLRRGRLEQATAVGYPGLRLGRFILELDILRQPEIDAVAAREGSPAQRGESDSTQVIETGAAGILAGRSTRPLRSQQELLGVQLMRAGLLKLEELQQALTRQSTELLLESLCVGRGQFRFVRTAELPPSAIDPDRGGALGLDIEAMLLEGARRQDAWHQVDRDAAEGAVYVSQVKSSEDLRQIGLAPTETTVLLLCTGRTGMADIARESRMPLAEVQKALRRLQALGLCRRRLPAVLAS